MVRFALEPEVQEHAVQLFDAPRSLAEATARFLAPGWNAGAPLLVAARPRHLELITAQLGRLGYDVPAAITSGHLRCIDATGALRQMRRRGRFEPELARAVITEVLMERSRPGHTIWGYGEIVDLLAEEGDYEAAAALEEVWNSLRERYPFTLLCGYSAAHFTDPRSAAHLRTICAQHTAVHTHAADSLGTWLTSDRAI